MGGENQVPQSAWNLLHLEVTIDGFHTIAAIESRRPTFNCAARFLGSA